jgi:hypothetical protein
LVRVTFVSGLMVFSVASLAFALPAETALGRAAAVAAALADIEHGLTATRYQHQARIDARKGVYLWDCSIMAAWILTRTAPEARHALAADKPLARDFYRTIDTAPTDRPRRGWRRLTDPAALVPGDVFAWLKPALFKERHNTGHVGFVLGRPWRDQKHAGIWLMRIADATTELHGADSRPPRGEGGFGTATIAFAVDEKGEAVAYGWYGEGQDPQTFVRTHIVFGRVFR